MNIANPRDCVIVGRAVKQVQRFKYLGTVMSWDGLLKVELEERLSKVNQAMSMLRTVYNNNNLLVPTKTKI